MVPSAMPAPLREILRGARNRETVRTKSAAGETALPLALAVLAQALAQTLLASLAVLVRALA